MSNLFGHTTVVGLRDASPGYIYIGRAGRGEKGTYGNPYSREEWGDQALVMFDLYLDQTTEKDPVFRSAVLDLDGQELACPGNCKPGPCHGDYYVTWLGKHQDEVRRHREKKAKH